MNQWLEIFRALGQSLADLAAAEVAALKEELARNGKTLGLALALFGAAAVIGFWLIALFLYTVIQILAAFLMPLWAASLTVFVAILVLMAVLALIGVVKLKKLESPAVTVGRRWSDHRRWWDRRLLAETSPPAELAGAEGGEEPDGGMP
jgi:hypothetical protein